MVGVGLLGQIERGRKLLNPVAFVREFNSVRISEERLEFLLHVSFGPFAGFAVISRQREPVEQCPRWHFRTGGFPECSIFSQGLFGVPYSEANAKEPPNNIPLVLRKLRQIKVGINNSPLAG
jgi:hypothetical protein